MQAPMIYRPYFAAVTPSIPLAGARVPAGFPSPANDYIESMIDLNQYLITKPAATFILRMSGNSMTKAGIYPGDLLIVDRSLTPTHGHIIIAILEGEFTVKRLYKRNGRCLLLPENDEYRPIEITQPLEIWGVVKHAIHSFNASAYA